MYEKLIDLISEDSGLEWKYKEDKTHGVTQHIFYVDAEMFILYTESTKRFMFMCNNLKFEVLEELINLFK